LTINDAFVIAGLVDTAVKTAETGYMQRRLVKVRSIYLKFKLFLSTLVGRLRFMAKHSEGRLFRIFGISLYKQFYYIPNQWTVYFARSDWLLKLGIVCTIHHSVLFWIRRSVSLFLRKKKTHWFDVYYTNCLTRMKLKTCRR